MNRNIGGLDRIVRILVAIVIGILYFTQVISGVLALVLLTLGVVFIVTSIFSICPLYSILGMSTCDTKSK